MKLQFRVTDKVRGVTNATLETLSLWKGELIYNCYDKWGTAWEKPVIAKISDCVIEQCINGEWEVVTP
jgi:hypothetical protein